MAFISGTGTGFAGLTRGLATSMIALVSIGATAPGSLDADLHGFRSQKGQVLACLTTRPDRFPDCQRDPHARRLTVPTTQAGELKFEGLPSGTYALALIHDENGNGKLDTLLGIPREGFGFSKNPAIRFGAPKFAEAEVAIASGVAAETVRVKYLF